ncbi:hypothetical protein B9Z55_003133 [Caenorhabditis nigoni]|uniref:F-box domain-containing protein n=1 Tax=Caenorhabditis nigoni TaxID=1611254 RepID=A0A2G5VPC3_9PELO|nr:hypothetical protein B9Z55_003133 [Caenorhabditis nigoni]
MSILSGNLLQMPIDLLKFPNDLLREVLKLCDPFELYKLSKCSKKRSQKATILRGTKRWKISYYGGNDMIIWTDGPNYRFKQTDNPEDYFKTTRRYGNYMYIEFPKGGPVELFVYLLELFGIRTVEFLEPSFGEFDNVSKVAKLSIDRKMEVEAFRIRNIEEVQDVLDFMPLLNQMDITREFQCSIKFPPEFHFEFVKYPSQIYIRESSWFTIGQLLDCTCVRIELDNSTFNNRDLDVFLHEWKNAGAFPNLRVLKIESEKIDNQSPILEMIPPITNVNNPRIEVSINNKFYYHILDGVPVNKDDGTEGWLKVELGGYSPRLQFLIADPADTVVEEIPEDDDDDW